MTVYRVRHETIYTYGAAVATSHNEIHLLPRDLDHQKLIKLELRCDPAPETVRFHRDWFGNGSVFLAIGEPHERLAIRTESRVEVHAAPAPRASASPAWERVAAQVRRDRDDAWLGALEFVFPSTYIPMCTTLQEYASQSFHPGRPMVEALLDLSRRIHADFEYHPDATELATPIEEVLRDRRGVCQDFAHLMIGCLRSLGLPARYVSGYLRSGPRKDDPGEEMVGAEASHAWVSAYCPVNGWVDVDPTNDVVPGESHIVLAWGRDYDDVSPVKGVTLGGGGHTLEVAVEVHPESEAATA